MLGSSCWLDAARADQLLFEECVEGAAHVATARTRRAWSGWCSSAVGGTKKVTEIGAILLNDTLRLGFATFVIGSTIVEFAIQTDMQISLTPRALFRAATNLRAKGVRAGMATGRHTRVLQGRGRNSIGADHTAPVSFTNHHTQRSTTAQRERLRHLTSVPSATHQAKEGDRPGDTCGWMRSCSRGIQGGSRFCAAIVTGILQPLTSLQLLWTHRFHPLMGRHHFPRLAQQRAA